jgi:hypothetical protein
MFDIDKPVTISRSGEARYNVIADWVSDDSEDDRYWSSRCHQRLYRPADRQSQ